MGIKHSARKGLGRRRVRFAVVGQGYFAQAAVLPAFASAKNCELVALFSDDARKLKALRRRYGVEHALTYDQYDEFLASQAVDAVYIALPNNLHREYTVRAANAGVHVLCEKPMAVTEADCDAMIQACEANRVKLMIAYRLHFEATNLSAIDIVQSGKLGDPRLFSSVFSFQAREGNIRLDPDKGGGPLFDIGVYCINAARYLFRDEPTQVVALTASGADRRFRGVEEMAGAILRFPGERLAVFTVAFGAADEGFYEVVGTKGTLCVESAYEHSEPMSLQLTVGGKTKERTFKKRDQVAPELVHFGRCILEDRTPEPSGIEGLTDVRIVQAIYRSVREGRAVTLKAPAARVERPSRKHEMTRRAHGMPPLVSTEPPTRR